MTSAYANGRLKRAIDVLLALAGLTLSAPVQAAVAVVVRRDVGRPVMFRQSRPGRGGRLFTLCKFRTMREGGATDVARDAERLTRTGAWLRSTSLDELPSLWNVLRGDMSLVGPRPLLPAYLERYDEVQARRHEVRPGLTGWAQVNGRNALCWERRLELDVEYVERASLWMDARILARTVRRVLGREGVTDGASATSAEFRGIGPAGS